MCSTTCVHKVIAGEIINHIYIYENKLLTSISQLLADHCSISVAPQVITHCPPLVIDAHLHSTLILIGPSHQTNISISTVATRVDCDILIKSVFQTLMTLIYHISCTYLDISLQHPYSKSNS